MDPREALERLRGSPLSSPARLAVMLLLAARGSMEFGDIARALGLTPGNLWSHLEKLKRRGLVRTWYRPGPQGPRMIVEATEEGIRELVGYLEALHSLERLAEEKKREGGQRA